MHALDHVSLLPERLWRSVQRLTIAWGRIFYLGAVVWVLVLSPSTYSRGMRLRLARHMYQDTVPILLGFTALAALLSVVITRIVVVTAFSYGLSRYALEMVIRVLVLELIPLTAALFVAMRATIPNGTQLALMRQAGHLDALRRRGADPVRMELLPRVVAGVYASITLAALSCVVALVMVYLSVYGFTLAGAQVYTRMFGQVFAPHITLVFALKTLFFSLAIALIPMASGLYETRSPRRAQQPGSELGGLARMFAVLLLIEVVSLMSNYY
ncbi:MlaE family ABC transporter permease [Melaminivora alkalimesophila]|uniref:Phospholipid/cholesterol/gamma-HCH transport system permease protein n=1 Tax=Melaminivora alkalimesophila TaxID=1165852 RepID=A0A317RAX0_9BURK|nr:ABC transporter permease [Melaminivora alkalimesophila]PWW46482.1 phospholipid/cholesterol/gamma-HCH transport system permease protein [Melaminivora alkalimesophila]